MNTRNKILGVCMSVIFTFTVSTTVFAADNPKDQNKDSEITDFQQMLEEIAKEKGISVEDFKAQLKIRQELRLEKMAKKKGITVEELKAKIKAKKAEFQEKLERKAKEKGITVEELKTQLRNERKAKHEAKLVEMAKKKGITVDELKAQIRAKKLEKIKNGQ